MGQVEKIKEGDVLEWPNRITMANITVQYFTILFIIAPDCKRTIYGECSW